MELKVHHNCSFMMSLVGYQFPELEDVEFDSNWLSVELHEGRGRVFKETEVTSDCHGVLRPVG